MCCGNSVGVTAWALTHITSGTTCFGPWGYNLNKLGRDLLRNTKSYKFHTSEPSGSDEEEFLILSHVFLWFKPGCPGEGPFWALGPLFEQTWFGMTRQCCTPNFKLLSLAVLDKKILSIYFTFQ